MLYAMRGVQYWILLLVLVAMPGAAGAAVIFDNEDPGLDNAWFSGYANGAWYEVYDNFVLEPGASVVTDIHWWGVYNTEAPARDDFVIAVFEDNGGEFCGSFWLDGPLVVYRPGTVTREFVLHDRQRLILEGSGDETPVDLFAYDYVLTEPLVLTPDHTYWLTIINRTNYIASDLAWYWESSGAATGNGLWLADSVGCDCTGGELAFRLTGERVIPEPAGMALLALGLLTKFGVRRLK